ncbi:polyketide synthase [Tricladium varicosporioides]|nr:polyketide synthase [Hymenoscyphus varicosporioides]
MALLPESKSEFLQEPVAVIGLACRLPGNCNSPTAFWDFLERGGVARNEAPATRFNLKTHHDDYRKPKTMRSPGGMFLENIDPQDFDAQFFRISGVDAIAMDPQQRQLLEVVYECLENAGIPLEAVDGEQIGCFVGSFAVDYGDMQNRDPEDRPPTITVGAGRAILSNRISHFLNIKGPSMTIDTACSGALVSVDVACRYLNTHEINGAIVAASNIYLSPEHVMDEGSMRGVASTSGRCHTFDVKADGYIKAEAVNAVMLKRLSDAIRDGDPIRGIIRGSATNSDGRTPGIASPSSEAQAAAIRAAYRRAGIPDLGATAYVECHGTGTQAGDPIEVNGVASVFSQGRSANNPLIIGSVKSNIGHSEPAAGISGLIKSILSIEKGLIPRNPTFQTPNPKIDFDNLNLRVLRNTTAWPSGDFRRASVNSFGYGGSNAHVIVDNHLPKTEKPLHPHVSSFSSDWELLFADEKVTQPVTLVFSANDEKSLRAYCKAICDHLGNPGVVVKLPDLAYTLSERRSRHFNRAYVVTDNTNLNEGAFNFGKQYTDTPKVGFVFTGQGAQWSQMGKGLIETFPLAKEMVQRLDDVLQNLPSPPSWSLLNELTEARASEHLRSPEFSQPLVTALQLAILAVLENWKVSPISVVGHSSGEIAASYAAGLLTAEEAIKVAYFRGQACTNSQDETPLGMLAAGLGAEQIQSYLEDSNGLVQVACYNSPNSVTLSGEIQELEKIRNRLLVEGHFARMLQVNFAYHSKFMADPAASYYEMLQQNCSIPQLSSDKICMYSSLTGKLMDRYCGADYWKSNMESPVRFDEAIREMISGRGGADFLIEIGPSGALAGPIAQVKKALGDQGSKVQYCASSSRGKESVKSLFDVAGRLFIAGSPVAFSQVNNAIDSTDVKPSVIVDLPNYVWNHSTKYWHESEASKDWRFRKFPHHDLLGTKILSTSWHSPVWKKTLKVENLQWMKDHKMGQDIVFPAAGFIAMAVEALYQARQATDPIEENLLNTQYRYRLRNSTFPKALVLEEKGLGVKVMLSLSRHQDSWYEFVVSSLTGETWNEHSRGLIRLEKAPRPVATETSLAPLEYPTPARLWYKAMNEAGYNFGPIFQKHIRMETRSGVRKARSLLSMTEPEEEYRQSKYAMHPVNIDGCLQTVSLALFRGNRADIDAVLIPAIIDNIVIIPTGTRSEVGMAITSSRYVGVGRPEASKNYKSDVAVYDSTSKGLLFEVSGLHFHQLEVLNPENANHVFCNLNWKPDISFLTQDKLAAITSNNTSTSDRVQQLLDIAAHKKPGLKVMEVNISSADESALWLEDGNQDRLLSRTACKEYRFSTPDANTLMNIQEKYASQSSAKFELVDFTRSSEDLVEVKSDFDLVLLKMGFVTDGVLSNILTNARNQLAQDGHILLLRDDSEEQYSGEVAKSEDGNSVAETDSNGTAQDSEGAVVVSEQSEQSEQTSPYSPTISTAPTSPESIPLAKFEALEPNCTSVAGTTANQKQTEDIDLDFMLRINGFHKLLNIHSGSQSISLAKLRKAPTDFVESHTKINLVRFSEPNDDTAKVVDSLKDLGWSIEEHFAPFSNLQSGSTILVLDEMTAPLLKTATAEQWQSIKDLACLNSKILWVTVGSQFEVSKPDNALIHGLARVMRAEDPLLSFVTLDLEKSNHPEPTPAISQVLKYLENADSGKYLEREYVERNGVVYISRVQTGEKVNPVEKRGEEDLPLMNIHESKNTINLRCERIGTMDSLNWVESSTKNESLADDFVEVEIVAAGLNFKDLAVTMGIVPENEHLLGLEGAGIIKQVGKSVEWFSPGQRVLFHNKGAFANRLQLPAAKCHLIPNSISFENAATMPSVHLVTIYGLLHKADLQKGQRVLIHSATGGVGISAIQLCRHVGAEIFATVGTDTKRKFLMDTFSIPSDHIFSSRDSEFATRISEITNGEGVDVILNSLTGDLLDASWHSIADGGIMIEIGKTDMQARKSLSMEPFNRAASYIAVDMSHKTISDRKIGSLLSEMMDLVKAGHITPIAPVTVFPFEEIVPAFRFLRGATHLGKVVISSGGIHNVKVPVRPTTPELSLRPDGSYLIVGGLKGLCGSLAIYLAKLGAKHLAVLCRSGYADEKSQGILANVYAEGCRVDLFEGDVTNYEDVQRVFRDSTVPIRGLIQGSMVLRDKIYSSMTVEEFHQCIAPKVAGTWNLHNASIEQTVPLDSFTILSSISGVIGQKGQANYAAANMFLDSFAAYRHGLGLAASSVDLGVIHDVGYVSERADLESTLHNANLAPINEPVLHRILRHSLLEQSIKSPSVSSTQIITGLNVPLEEDSALLQDVRFGALCVSDSTATKGNSSGSDASKEIRAFFLLLNAKSDPSTLLTACVSIVSKQFSSSLRLSEPMEPGKPLTSYGLDSLAAVEFRNWLRMELSAEFTTLEILGATSLFSMCEKIIAKITPAEKPVTT